VINNSNSQQYIKGHHTYCIVDNNGCRQVERTNMYWSKVIIASLVASPSFARQQRLGGPALLDHVEMVSEGTVFDEQPLTQFSSRTLVADQQDGVDADAYDGQDIDNNDDGVDEPESVSSHLSVIYLPPSFTCSVVHAVSSVHMMCSLCISCTNAH